MTEGLLHLFANNMCPALYGEPGTFFSGPLHRRSQCDWRNEGVSRINRDDLL